MAWELLETVSDSNTVRDAEISPDGEWLVLAPMVTNSSSTLPGTGFTNTPTVYGERLTEYRSVPIRARLPLPLAQSPLEISRSMNWEGWTEIYSESTSLGRWMLTSARMGIGLLMSTVAGLKF